MTSYLTRPEGRIAYDRTGEGPMVVLVPGMGDLRSSYRLLVPELVAAGFTAVSVDLRQIFFRQVEVLGSTMGSKGDLHEALPLVEAGKIKPVVDRVMPLWEARQAHEILESRKAFGKIVLSVSGA